MSLGWFLRFGADGTPIGFGHSGSGGQYLMIYPAAKLVVVRLVRLATSDWDRAYATRRRMPGLGNLADRLAMSRTQGG